MKDLPPAGRVPLLVLGMVSLVAGTLAGLARLGWDVPGLAAARAGTLEPVEDLTRFVHSEATS